MTKRGPEDKEQENQGISIEQQEQNKTKNYNSKKFSYYKKGFELYNERRYYVLENIDPE